jgi:hypothetical protein
MAEVQIATAIEMPHKAGRIKDLVQGGIIDHAPAHPAQDFRGIVLVVVALAMRPMHLLITANAQD